MTSTDYRRVLTAARRDLDALYRDREELERKIARLRQTIISLGALTKESPQLEKKKKWFRENEPLTEAVMNVIMASEVPVSATEIKESLEELGYDIGSTNPLASVWSVLRRLEQRRWGDHPYIRQWVSEEVRPWGKGKRHQVRVGWWWGDRKPAGNWKRYESPMKARSKKKADAKTEDSAKE